MWEAMDIQESRYFVNNKYFMIGQNRPDSNSDSSDEEADKHIWNETREVICAAIGVRVMPTLFRYKKTKRILEKRKKLIQRI